MGLIPGILLAVIVGGLALYGAAFAVVFWSLREDLKFRKYGSHNF